MISSLLWRLRRRSGVVALAIGMAVAGGDGVLAAEAPARKGATTQSARRSPTTLPAKSKSATVDRAKLAEAMRRARTSTQRAAATARARAEALARQRQATQARTSEESNPSKTALSAEERRNRFKRRLQEIRERSRKSPTTSVETRQLAKNSTPKAPAPKANNKNGAQGRPTPPPAAPQPPPEERKYVLSFQKATWDEILNTFCRWSGLTIMGKYPTTTGDGITYINQRPLTYHEALHELNLLLMQNIPSYYLMREKNHLMLRRMSDWPHYVPMDNRFYSVEEFKKAEIDDDEWAMVFYTPEVSDVGEVITEILQTMPDGVVLPATMGETRRLKVTGIVHYIRQFIRLAESDMFKDEAADAAKLRKIKFYKIERAQASSVQQVLERIVLPPKRTRFTSADESQKVDMVLDQLSNTIIVKAREEHHREIEAMIEKIEKAELVSDAQVTFLKLEHARAEDLANLMNPLLQRQASMKPSFDRRQREREQVYLQADPASNSLIVLAAKEGLERVKKLLEQLDVETPEAQYRRIELEHVNADQIFTVVNNIVQSRQGRFRGRRGGGQQLQVMPDPTGNALFVMGNPKDMEFVEELVAELDAEDVERTKTHIIKLKKARPSMVSQGLQAIFGGDTGGRRRRTPTGSFRALPDDQSGVLVVICLDKDWKEIEQQIKEFDEQSVSTDPVMRTIPITHGDAEEIATTLNNALRGRLGRTPVTVGADRKNNMLFVTTLEPAFEEIESLIEKLDKPSKEGKLEVIPLQHASATDVANLITQMFTVTRSRGRFGGGGTAPVIIPDQIANALVVRATKTDLAEIELQAARIDDAARDEGNRPTIIPLEYADPSQVASMCETMFIRRTSRRSRSAEQTTFFMPIPTGLVVRAPSQQMGEIKDFIETVDSPESVNVEIKTVQLPGQDVEQIASILQNMFAGERRRRSGGGSINFLPNPSSDMLVITAPKKRFEEIDKVIQQYTEGVKVAQASMKMIDLNNARADEVAQLLTEMLGAKLGRRGRRSEMRQVQILRDPRQNKLIVFAPDDIMQQAEEMVKQLDVPIGDEGGVRWIELENADASYVASTLQQMWETKQRRGRPRFEQLPVQIWAEAITNSVLVMASQEDYKEIEKLAKELDSKFKSATTQPTIVKLKYAEPSYVITMCQEMFLPRAGQRPGARRSKATESISFIPMRDGLMVRAPQSRMKDILEFIERLDDPGETKLTVKRYHLKGMDVQTLYTTLSEVFSKTDLQRDEPRPGFAVDPPNETVTVTCWTSRLPDIEKVVEDFKKAEAEKEPSKREMIEVKYTRATYAASTLESLLRKELGDRAARLGSRLSIGVEDRLNRVVVFAPPDVMEKAKAILATIDVKMPGATTRASDIDFQVVKWIPMENIDASSAASTINQIWEASQPPRRSQENRPPIRIWPETITNTVLVAGAYGKEYELIETIAQDIDQKAIENPNKPILIKLDYATPSEVTSMVEALFVPPGRRRQKEVMISTVSGGVIVRAPKVKLKEIQEFIDSYDEPDATGLKIQTFYLPQTNVSELASTLSTIFGYKERRRNEPGWSFIPNTDADMLMVLAPETRMKEIEEVIKEYEENVQKMTSKMQMFDLQFTRADYVVGVLNDLLREKLRRTRGRRAVNQLQISYESRQNKVVVFAPDEVMKQVEEMIKQIDIELPDEGDRVKWIQIEYADAGEVAQTVEQMFEQKRGSRRRRDSYSIREVRIWPERVTNSILVSADQEDYEEIEKLAKKIDEEYATKGLERVKITPKYVSVSQIQSLIDSLFYARTHRRDVRHQTQRIRIIPAGAYSFFLEAPKDKLSEVQKLIEEMDTEGENAPIVKTFKMGDVDVRQLAQALSMTTGNIGSYMPDPRRGALIVSAPKHQFDRIEKAMEQLKADIEEEEAQFRVFTLKHAQPNAIDGQLRSLISMRLSRRTRYRGEDLRLSLMADRSNNRLFVYAGPEEMALVESMLEELDVPGLSQEAVLRTLPLERTDCEYMASVIQQVFTPEELKRRRVRRGMSSQDAIPIRVVPEPTTNTLLVTCAEEDFREIELFVARQEDAYREKEKALELITPKYVTESQLMATVNAIYNPPRRRGERQKRYTEIRAIPASGSSFFLEAPKDKMEELKELIAKLDVEDQNRPVVRTYKLKDVDVRQLTRLLQTTMQNKGSFIADPRMGMVIVSAREFQFPEIEEMMTKLQKDFEETRQQFEIIELEHARPSSVYSTLSQLVSIRMSERRSRRGQSLQLSMIPDDSNGRLFVYAAQEEMELVKEMLGKLDIPGMIKEAQLFTIELDRLDCSYMASKIQQVFTPEELKRRRVQRGDSAQDLIPIRVVPEDMTNSLLITCAEEDFQDIQKFVMEREAAYTKKDKVRELITPKFISQNQLMATINAIYNPPRRRGVRQKDVPDIRAIPASGSSFYLEAPKDKMPELLELVKTLDVEDENQPVVRTYRVKDVDVRQLASLLQQTMQNKGSFYADTRMEMLIVSAPEFRFEKIEQTMNDLKENLEAVRQQFKVFPLKFAKASNIYSQLSQLVTTRVRGRRGNAELTILPDQVLNRLFVYAGDEEMKVVEDMLAELDVEGVEPEQQVYSIELENADCSWAASMVQNMFTQEELRRRRRGRTGTVVAPIRVLADQMSNRLLIWASPRDYEDIEKFVMELDERAEETKIERRILQPKFIRANELYGMIQTLFLQQRRRTGQRQEFIETFMVMSGADIILNGPKDRLDEIEQFVKSVDTEERAKLEIKTFELPDVDLNSLISMLNQVFAQDARRQRGNTLFIPDPQNNELMVSAPKSLMKDIEELIDKKREGAAKRSRRLTMVEVKHTDANYLANMLRPLIVEKARSRRGRYVQPEVTITPEPRMNRLLIMAAEAETQIAMELIQELDTEAMALKGQVRTIELKKAEASYVASTLQTMFSRRSQMRQSYSSSTTPVYVVAEEMTNRLFVAASDADFKEIEKLAQEMDEAAELEGVQEEKIEIKFANPSQLVSVIQQMFTPLKSRGRRQESDVRLNVMGTNIIAQAPAKKMVEIKRWIQELDVEEFAETVTKFIPLEIARAREIVGIIQPMLQAKAQELELRQGQRKRRGGELQVLPDVRNNRLIITAQSQIVTMAEELIKELDVEDPAWTGETVEIVDLDKADATQVAQVLDQILRDDEGGRRRRPKKGSSREYTGLAVTIVPDAASNTLILKGLPRELDRVKELVAEIEEKAVAGGVQFQLYRLEESDAEEVATVVQQMVTAASGARGRRAPVQVTSNYMMNAVFVAGTAKQQTMAKAVIDAFEEPAYEIDPVTGEKTLIERKPFEFITLEYSDAYDLLYDIESLVEKRFGEKGPTLETLWNDSSVLMVSGKPDQVKYVKELVQFFEDKNAKKPPVTRTLDLGMLRAEDLKRQLGAWGLADPNKVTLVGEEPVGELVKEITIKHAMELRQQAKDPNFSEKEGGRTRSKKLYRKPKTKKGGSRFEPPSVLAELRAELSGIVCSAKATTTKPVTTQRTKTLKIRKKKAPTTAAVKNAATVKAKAKPKSPPATKKQDPKAKSSGKARADAAKAAAERKQDPKAKSAPKKADSPSAADTKKILGKSKPSKSTAEPVVRQATTAPPKAIQVATPDKSEPKAKQRSSRKPAAKSNAKTAPAKTKPASAKKDPEAKAAKTEAAPSKAGGSEAAKKAATAEATEPVAPRRESSDAESLGLGMRRTRGDEPRQRRQPPVEVIIDAKTGTIQVKGPDRKVAEIEELIGTLQWEIEPPAGKETEIRVYQPEYIDVNVAAALLERVFNERRKRVVPPKRTAQKGKKEEKKEPDEEERMMSNLREMMRSQGAAAAAAGLRIVPDSRTGYLVIRGHPETIEEALELLAKMDVPGLPPGDIRYFHLVNLDAQEVEQSLKAVLKLETRRPKLPAIPKDQNKAIKALQQQIQQLQGATGGVAFTSDQVTITSNASTNTLICMAPDEVMKEIEDFIDTLETEAGGIEIETLTLDAADATQVAKSMTSLYSRRAAAGKGSAAGGLLTITADAASNTIFVRGPRDLRAEVIARVKELDSQASEMGKPFRIELTNADAEVIAPKLQAMFETRKARKSQQVSFFGDNASNTLVVRAPETMREQIMEMVKALDVESVDIDFRVFPLEHAMATEVHQALTQMTMQVFAQLRQQGKRNMKMDVFAAVPDPRTNSLVVTGGETTFLIVEKILSQLDVEPRGVTEQVTVLYQLQQADASQVAQAITRLYSSGRGSRYLKKTGMEPPQAEYDSITNTVIVRTTEKLHKMIKKEIIDKLEDFSKNKKIKDVTLALEHAKADDVAQILTEYFSQKERRRRGKANPNDFVLIVAEPDTNSLLIQANEENLEVIQGLVAKMDREDVAGRSARKTKVIQLEYADPGSTASAIRQAFEDGRRSRRSRVGLRDRVDAVPEYTTGSLIVTASAENMKEVDAIIEQLDVETATKRETKQVKLEHADATEVARQLTQMFSQTRGRTRRGILPVIVTADERTNSVIVSAKAKDLTEVEKLVKTLDVPSDLLERRKLRIFQLEWADPYGMAQMISQAFRTRGGRRSPSQEVFATAEYSTGSLIVSASPDNMELIEQLVKDVDQEGTTGKKMHVLEVKNAEAADIADALEDMFVRGRRRSRGGQTPVSLVSPEGTNKIMVMASEAEYKKIAEAVQEMDVGAADTAVRSIRLVNIAPEEAQTILEEFLRKPGRRGRYDPTLMGNVRVTVSPSAGSLIITARKEKLDELEALIKKIDAEAAEEGAGVRKIAVFRLDFANPYYTAQAISTTFRKSGRVAESDLVTATAEASTSAVIVAASERNLEKIRKFIEELDVEDSGRRITETIKLQHAQADEVSNQLNQIFRQTRSYTSRGQLPVTVTGDTRTNSLIVAARPNEIEDVKKLVKMLDVEPDEMLGRKLQAFTLRYTDPGSMASIINSGFRTQYGQPSPSELVQATAEYGTNSVVVSATQENLDKVEKLISQVDTEGSGTKKTHIIEVRNAEPEDVADALEEIFVRGRGRRGQTQPTITNPQGTSQIVVRANEEDFKEIQTLVEQLDAASGEGMGEEVRLVRLTHVPPEEAEEILQEFLRKPGRRSRYDTTLRGNVRITPSRSAGGLIISARKERLDELEALIKKFDVDEPEDSPGTRKIEIFPLEYANTYYVAQAITTAFRTTGRRTAESDIVTATAEPSTGSVIVSAAKKNMEKVRKFIEDLDKEDKRGREVRVIKLTKARAEEVAQTLTTIYRTRSRGSRGEEPVTITAEEGTNTLVISAKKSEHEEVAELVKQLDVDPTANEDMAVVGLEHLDAPEALEIMESYLQRPGSRRGELAGGTRLAAAESMNALIISGQKENVARARKVLADLDQPGIAEDRVPKLIPLEHAQASLMASTLEEIFVEPAEQLARRRRGTAAQLMVPLIKSDESTNSLIVRARKSDFNRIEDMAKLLDREDFGGQIKIIPVPATMDVIELASIVERSVNEGERYRAQKTGQRPSMVSVAADDRTNSLIVSGAPEQFAQVEQVVKQLQAVKPAGEPTMRIIQLKNLQSDEIKDALEEMMQESGRSRRYRRRY